MTNYFPDALFLKTALYGTTGFLSLLTIILIVECGAALLPVKRAGGDRQTAARRPSVVVLIPAHNEAEVIGATLLSLIPTVAKGDRILLVADNCTDETAEIGRRFGVEVIERFDSDRRGKGYALDFGFRSLQNCPPDVVVVIDADCQVALNTVERLAETAVSTGSPVQATNLLLPPGDPSPKHAVLSFAFLFKNLVRQRGLQQLGLPVGLTGTGMAFPWSIIRTVSTASGNIVEDKQMGLDFALQGYSPIFCEEALVTGTFPEDESSLDSQKTRWTHGHLQTLVTQVPQLLRQAAARRSISLLALALDTAVPPLSLLVLLWTVTTGVAGVVGLLGGPWLPAIALGAQGGILFALVAISWLRFARAFLPLRLILSVPMYMLWKLSIYRQFLLRPQRAWVRTGREPSTGQASVNPSSDRSPFHGETASPSDSKFKEL